MTKKLKQAFAEPISNGWVIHRSSNHLMWKHPGGGTVTTAKTPSDHRSVKNALRYFKSEDIKYGRSSL